MGYIHSIETFGTVDGPGVRFVVFFQGCPMRCAYCHNPDTWLTGDGQEMSADEILNRMERNREFYRTGGLTATGGEPMLQLDFLTELFTKAKKRGIHTCLDTSGITFPGWKVLQLQRKREEEKQKAVQNGQPILQKGIQIDRLMQVTDLVMLDIKHMDEEEHRKLTGHSNKKILEFAEYLDSIGKPVWIRHVVIPGITFKEQQLLALGAFLKTLHNIERVDVLPYHSMGKVKYDNLEIEYPLKDIPQLTKEEANEAESIIKRGMHGRG